MLLYVYYTGPKAGPCQRFLTESTGRRHDAGVQLITADEGYDALVAAGCQGVSAGVAKMTDVFLPSGPGNNGTGVFRVLIFSGRNDQQRPGSDTFQQVV